MRSHSDGVFAEGVPLEEDGLPEHEFEFALFLLEFLSDEGYCLCGVLGGFDQGGPAQHGPCLFCKDSQEMAENPVLVLLLLEFFLVPG